MASYDVPFTSQYEGIADPAWQWRGCGVVGLKMVLDYWHSRSLGRTGALDELFRTGTEVGAYREGIGWTHRGLVEIASRYGYTGFNADYAAKGPTPKAPEEAWAELKRELEHGPILASVFSRLDPERGGGHIVVVTGFSDGLVSFNDPEEMDEREGRKLLAEDQFLRAFKLRYVGVRPPDHSASRPTAEEQRGDGAAS